ncbi:MAG TPA: formylglycine-generating enzyme family protein, partial [Niastella sp.]|nr:formylglycine-generating enzyme family protein [Niastella sp.]
MNYSRLALICFLLIQTGLQSIAQHKNSIGIQLVDVKAGTFTMGSNRGKEDADESPVHDVTISKGFKMSATEITNKQYEAFDHEHNKLRGKNGFSLKDDEAVVFVSYEEAVAFCAWLSKKEGKPYRLPTEAEWEYACRAGSTTDYNTGNELPAEYQK